MEFTVPVDDEVVIHFYIDFITENQDTLTNEYTETFNISELLLMPYEVQKIELDQLYARGANKADPSNIEGVLSPLSELYTTFEHVRGGR